MATISNTPRPGYVWDATDNCWYPIGTGPHTHAYIPEAIVDAKGDLITATAADTPARLAVGNNGETLVADSSATTGLRWQGNYAAGKNAIINGDFSIWQRGTTFTNATVNTYTADRWFFGGSGNNTGSISRQTFTPGTAPVSGYEGKYFLRFDQTTTAITPSIIQKIEDVQTFAGQTVTVSFWYKTSSNITGGLTNAYLEQVFGSGGSATVSTILFNPTNTTTTWQRMVATVTLPSISGKTIGTSSYLQLTIYPKASTVITLDIWGVQVEAGNTATAFQTATGTLAGELAACQRYYFRYNAANVYTRLAWGSWGTTTSFQPHIKFPVTMRIAPSSVEYSTLTTYDTVTFYAVSAIALDSTGTDATNLIVTTAASTQYRFGYLLSNNSTAGYIGFNSEL